MILWISIITIVAAICIWRITSFKKQNNPALDGPGPCLKLPTKGRLKTCSKEVGHILQNLSDSRKNYGDIFLQTTSMGVDNVYIGSKRLMEECLGKTKLTDRIPEFPNIEAYFDQILTNGHHRPINPVGEEWQGQTNLAAKILRDFGCGSPSMEDLILEELSAFSGQLREDLENGPIDMDIKFQEVVINIIWTIASGNRFDYEDEDFIYFVKQIENAFNPSKDKNIIIKAWNMAYDLLEKEVNNHLDEGKEVYPTNFIDIYIKEMKKKVEFGNGRSYFTRELGKHLLVCLLLEMFLAAVESTSSWLSWLVVHMVRNCQVQTKVQQELDQVIGPRKLPRLEDLGNTALTLAVMDEVQRMSSMIPLTGEHSLEEDSKIQDPVVVGGYFLPKDARIYYNLWEMNHDPQVWSHPDVFKPQRFLDEFGEYKPSEKLLRFGAGRRGCLGEVLSKAQVYPLFAGLLHQFSFRTHKHHQTPSLEYNYGVTLLPQPFKVDLISRPRQKTFRGRIRSDTD